MYEACILDRCLIMVPSSYGSLPPIASSLLTSAPYSYWSLPLIGPFLLSAPSSGGSVSHICLFFPLILVSFIFLFILVSFIFFLSQAPQGGSASTAGAAED